MCVLVLTAPVSALMPSVAARKARSECGSSPDCATVYDRRQRGNARGPVELGRGAVAVWREVDAMRPSRELCDSTY